MSIITEDEPDAEVRNVFDQWCQWDFLRMNFVLNALTDSLYSVCANVTTFND